MSIVRVAQKMNLREGKGGGEDESFTATVSKPWCNVIGWQMRERDVMKGVSCHQAGIASSNENWCVVKLSLECVTGLTILY